MKKITVYILLAILTVPVYSQLKDYAIHQRGMLWETVFNTGEIGRGYHQGQAGQTTAVPLMEWPAYSKCVIDQKEYDGRHNILGGGMYLAGYPTDTNACLFAMCGAVGSNAPELVAGKWSYPLYLNRVENYPVKANGDLNPSYNPDEAEEVIVSKWATPLGLTVTRTSRAWSFPDYDDFIIYEYDIENTGDRDGDTTTIESHAEYRDLIFTVAYGFAPNMFAYLRQYNIWQYQDYERKDQRGRFDRDRWMNYNLDMDAKPDPTYYTYWDSTQMFGGGLNAPGAVGYSMLHIDTKHLAKYSETQYRTTSASDSVMFWEPNTLTVKQPWVNYLETSNLRSSKVQPKIDLVQKRYSTPYKNAVFGPNWQGRGSFNARQTRKAVGRLMMLGPYTLKFGEKLHFAYAEVAGFGAARVEETRAGLKDEGGSCGEDCGETSDQAFYPVPNWYETVTYGGATGNAFTYGSTYLQKYPLPQYVNSNVVTIRDVADKAKYCYTGDTSGIPYWPEKFPEKGVYRIPIPVPAPVLELSNNALAQNVISWKNEVEKFSAPRLEGTFHHYELFKADHPLGPWKKLDSIPANDPRYFSNGRYTLLDKNTRIGESFYYSVLSVDVNGRKSGRTNITLHETQIGGTETLGKVYVVPNPFFVRSGFSGSSTSGDIKSKLGFYNLPKKCTIRIFSYSGQLVNTIEHESGLYSTAWYQITRNDQEIASGVYFYVVQTPEGDTYKGKFVVIR